jgi:hypothetical protein
VAMWRVAVCIEKFQGPQREKFCILASLSMQYIISNLSWPTKAYFSSAL